MTINKKIYSAIFLLLVSLFFHVPLASAQAAYWNFERDAADSNKLKFYYQTSLSNPALTITSDNKVGIGNTAPDSTLVVGADDAGSTGRKVIKMGHGGYSDPTAPGTNANGDKILFWSSSTQKVGLGFANDNSLWLQTSSDNAAIRFYTGLNSTAPTERMTITSGGNVGIGTTNPGAKLHLAGGQLLLDNHKYITWKDNAGSINGYSYYDNENRLILMNSNSGGTINFFTGGGGSGNERMTITSGGNVGIGTTNPGADKLDVRGTAYASGGWQTTDADYAEWFDKEEDAGPGDIIGVNLETGKVRKYRSGDKFIGIYSTRPGIVGNRTKEKVEDMKKTSLLVGLLGQLEFDASQTIIIGRMVYTLDEKEIGVLLSNGKVLLGR